jgi:hypothetical protein
MDSGWVYLLLHTPRIVRVNRQSSRAKKKIKKRKEKKRNGYTTGGWLSLEGGKEKRN